MTNPFQADNVCQEPANLVKENELAGAELFSPSDYDIKPIISSPLSDQLQIDLNSPRKLIEANYISSNDSLQKLDRVKTEISSSIANCPAQNQEVPIKSEKLNDRSELNATSVSDTRIKSRQSLIKYWECFKRFQSQQTSSYKAKFPVTFLYKY